MKNQHVFVSDCCIINSNGVGNLVNQRNLDFDFDDETLTERLACEEFEHRECPLMLTVWR